MLVGKILRTKFAGILLVSFTLTSLVMLPFLKIA
jgi:hypothetical protein